MRTLPETLLAEQGKLGSCSPSPIVSFFLDSLATCNGASGYVLCRSMKVMEPMLWVEADLPILLLAVPEGSDVTKCAVRV